MVGLDIGTCYPPHYRGGPVMPRRARCAMSEPFVCGTGLTSGVRTRRIRQTLVFRQAGSRPLNGALAELPCQSGERSAGGVDE